MINGSNLIGENEALMTEFFLGTDDKLLAAEKLTDTETEETTEAKGKELSIADAGVTAVFGYAVVFSGLIILMIVLYITGAIFKSKDAKAKAAAAEANAPEKAAPAAAPAVEKPAAPGSAGHVKLYDVPDKEAAMIMAIVADKMQKPINELHFISIKEVK